MGDDRDQSREPARIESVQFDSERGNTVWVHVSGECWGQGFGGMHLGNGDEGRKAYLRELCATFGVADPERLVGEECFVLRCFDSFGETIEGLESVRTGRRFVATDFAQRHFPESKIEDPLTRRIRSLEGSIDSHLRTVARMRAELATVRDRYVDWMPPQPERILTDEDTDS